MIFCLKTSNNNQNNFIVHIFFQLTKFFPSDKYVTCYYDHNNLNAHHYFMLSRVIIILKLTDSQLE